MKSYKHRFKNITPSRLSSLRNCFALVQIGHFTVVRLVTWPWIGSEAGGDLVSIQTSLLFICRSCCSYANYFAFTYEKQ